MANTNPNDAGNVFATLFGACKDGTSWAIDFLQTALWVCATLFVIDTLLPNDFQDGMPVLANTLLLTPTAVMAYYVWVRARADNRARKDAQ